jgi:hypothetical protein
LKYIEIGGNRGNRGIGEIKEIGWNRLKFGK